MYVCMNVWMYVCMYVCTFGSQHPRRQRPTCRHHHHHHRSCRQNHRTRGSISSWTKAIRNSEYHQQETPRMDTITITTRMDINMTGIFGAIVSCICTIRYSDDQFLSSWVCSRRDGDENKKKVSNAQMRITVNGQETVINAQNKQKSLALTLLRSLTPTMSIHRANQIFLPCNTNEK